MEARHKGGKISRGVEREADGCREEQKVGGKAEGWRKK
jgi:hypothetical protein